MVLNLDPANPDTSRPAAAALEALYTETSDTAALVGILRQQADWTDGAAERKALLFSVADLEAKTLGDKEAATATLRAILEIDPQDQTAISSLETIFEAGAQHKQRVEMLRKRIDLAQDPAARQELWRRVAGLLENDVGDRFGVGHVTEESQGHVPLVRAAPADAVPIGSRERGDRVDHLGRRTDRDEQAQPVDGTGARERPRPMGGAAPR